MAKLPRKRPKPVKHPLAEGAHPGKSTIERSYAALAEESFGASGYCGKSLLRSVVGRVRCAIPKNSLLVKIIQDHQGVYAALLGRLMSGASLTGAAAAVGLQRETVRSWMTQGLSDLASDKDTYYSRFATDCRAAFAHSVSEAEIAVHRRNPIEYLRTGPGRAFYQDRENYWQLPNPNAAPSENDIEPLAEISQSEQSSTGLPDERMAGAIDELRKLGILHNPEMSKQLELNMQTVHRTTTPPAPIIIDVQPST